MTFKTTGTLFLTINGTVKAFKPLSQTITTSGSMRAIFLTLTSNTYSKIETLFL
jgi:hypothetical protein